MNDSASWTAGLCLNVSLFFPLPPPLLLSSPRGGLTGRDDSNILPGINIALLLPATTTTCAKRARIRSCPRCMQCQPLTTGLAPRAYTHNYCWYCCFLVSFRKTPNACVTSAATKPHAFAFALFRIPRTAFCTANLLCLLLHFAASSPHISVPQAAFFFLLFYLYLSLFALFALFVLSV